MDFGIKETDGVVDVELKSIAPPCPNVVIKFSDIEVSTLRPEVIDEVDPAWNRPYGPLARMNLSSLREQLIRRKSSDRVSNE